LHFPLAHENPSKQKIYLQVPNDDSDLSLIDNVSHVFNILYGA
jgi:hypothetical protein